MWRWIINIAFLVWFVWICAFIAGVGQAGDIIMRVQKQVGKRFTGPERAHVGLSIAIFWILIMWSERFKEAAFEALVEQLQEWRAKDR